MGEADQLETSPLRSLPQVERLSSALDSSAAHWLRVDAARSAIAAATERIRAGSPAPSFEELVDLAADEVERRERTRLGRVINATGVLLHTNLGRAPLAEEALEAVRRVSSGYSNLEYDLEQGARGSRYAHCAQMLASITGAEAALVVNNNAGAVLLALRALAQRREAVISRGELIEIGGEFRIPDIMAESGAVLTEVGTTNRTHLRDYRNAIGPETAVILKVHPSNYEMTGFTASVGGRELAKLAREHDLKLIHDVGSGLVNRTVAGAAAPSWLAGEPSVVEAVAEGADLVTFSGDKLLGGPQAGLIVGKADAIAALRRSSLLRTLRTDKTTLAALDATLRTYRERREHELPLWRMAMAPADEIERRAKAVIAGVDVSGALLEVVDGVSTTGGGSAPRSAIPTPVIRVISSSTGAKLLAERLLKLSPPVVARVENGALEVNLRTVDPDHDELVRAALNEVLV